MLTLGPALDQRPRNPDQIASISQRLFETCRCPRTPPDLF